jgi:hypothetical protein
MYKEKLCSSWGQANQKAATAEQQHLWAQPPSSLYGVTSSPAGQQAHFFVGSPHPPARRTVHTYPCRATFFGRTIDPGPPCSNVRILLKKKLNEGEHPT